MATGLWLWLAAASALAAPVPADDLTGRLAHPDPAEREAAATRLLDLGDDARPLLRAARDDPRPAVARAARRLLSQVELGADRLSPLAPPEAVAWATRARDPASAGAERAEARRNLVEHAPYAAPLIARLLADAADDLDALRAVAADLMPLHDGDRRGRPAVVAALIDLGDAGEDALSAWLSTSAQLAGGGRNALVVGAATDHPFFDPAADADAPPQFVPNPADAMLVRALVTGEPPPASGASEPLTAAVNDLAVAMATGGDAEEPRRRVRAADDPSADPSVRAAAAMLLNEPATADEFAGEAGPMALLGWRWVRGEYEAAAGLDDLPQFADDNETRNRLRNGFRQLRNRDLLGNRHRVQLGAVPARAYDALRLAAYDALDAGDDATARASLRRLIEVDPDEPAWRRLLADVAEDSDEARRLRDMAGRMPLDDARRRLESAALVAAFDPNLADWAAEQEARAALLSVPVPGGTFDAARYAADAARRAGDWDRAARLQAAALAALLEPQLRAALAARGQGTRAPFHPVPHAARIVYDLRAARLNRLLEAGEPDAAAREYAAATELLPTALPATIDYARHLIEAGDRDAAGAVIRPVYARLSAAADEHEGSAMLANQAAWLAARTWFRPDAALDYATRAVGIEPRSDSLVDTLAEAHLAAGDAATALELMDQAVLLAGAKGNPLALSVFLARRADVRRRAVGEE